MKAVKYIKRKQDATGVTVRTENILNRGITKVNAVKGIVGKNGVLMGGEDVTVKSVFHQNGDAVTVRCRYRKRRKMKARKYPGTPKVRRKKHPLRGIRLTAGTV